MIRHYLKLIWKRRQKNAFLIAELILVFLVVFGVLAFSMKQLQKLMVPEGFQTDHVYNIIPSVSGELDSLTLKYMREQLKREILALDGVQSATYSTSVSPYGNSTWSTNVESDHFGGSTDYILCDEHYAEVWGATVVEGRFFTEADFTGKYMPIVVNRKFVGEYLKDTTAIGFTFRISGQDAKIVGIVDHFKYHGKFSEEVPLTMVPIHNHWSNLEYLSVLTKPNTSETIVKEMYDITARITKNYDLKIDKVSTIRDVQNRTAWVPIIGLFVLAGFLLINIAMGLFGILRYNISRRKPEIGLRKAMGASAAHIRHQFTGEMLVLTTLAMIVGLLFAIQVPFLDLLQMDKHIYWLAIVLALIIMYLIVILCSLIPSSQAAAVEPAVSLHEE